MSEPEEPGISRSVPQAPAVSKETFWENIREALENGYELACAYCGTGVFDLMEIHERQCPKYEDWTGGNLPPLETTQAIEDE